MLGKRFIIFVVALMVILIIFERKLCMQGKIWRIDATSLVSSNDHKVGISDRFTMKSFSCEQRDPQVIVYNRIPKTGSTTMMTLLKTLASLNNFTFVFPLPKYRHEVIEKAIFDAVSSGQRTLICNHFNFPEINYGHKVAYINVLRSPIRRCISAYYYNRYGDRNKVLKADYVQRYGNQTIQECVWEQVTDRTSDCLQCPNDFMTRIFCGKENGECDSLSFEEKLDRSLQNIQEYYTVGLTEDLPATIELFEAVFPLFFTGAKELMSVTDPRNVMSNKKLYAEPNDKLLNKISEHVATDMRLYDHVEHVFYNSILRCLNQRD